MSGSVIYRGPSRINSRPIVVIATDGTQNRKTGDMIQTWILAEDEAPHEAQRTGADEAVCGSCPMRPSKGGGCYVATFQAPLSVWRAYHRGVYHDRSPAAVGAGRLVRIGSYGDPAAVPPRIWRALSSRAAGRTGYTHQWRRFRSALRPLVMASCNSRADAAEAQSKGWRTFRVAPKGRAEPMPGEIVCPASVSDRQCSDCLACNGAESGSRRASIVIEHH